MSILDDYPPLRLGLRVTQMIVAALFVGVVVLLAIASFLVVTRTVSPADPSAGGGTVPLTWILLGVGALTLPLILFLRQRILAAARRDVLAGGGPRPQPGPTEGWERTGAAGRLFQGWQSATIVTAAGLEGIALLGAVGALVEGQPAGLVVGFAFALALLLVVPTQARLEHFLQGELALLETERGRRD